MQRSDLEPLQSRMMVLVYAISTAMLVLAGGFWHFQMAQTGYYAELADQNRFKQIPLLAPRGRIFDREGRILVDNRPSYNVVLVREDSIRPVEDTVAAIAPGLGVSQEELLARIEKRKSEPKFRPILLKEDVGVSEIAFVRSHQLELPEIRVEFQPRRRYLGDVAALAIGYVGEIKAEELKRPEFKDYRIGDELGRLGLERTYNNILRGKDGYRRVVVDNRQREIERLGEELPIPGNDIRTTIDLDLQRAAEEALGDQVGAAIALDPLTGEVLVLASKPSFDPNLFAARLSSAELSKLSADPRKPFWNRAIQDHYAPGSVFKIFMAAAGLESQTIDPLDHVHCTGVESIYGTARHCWKAGGHGSVSLYEAIVNSCNIFFYNIGKKMDIDRIAQYSLNMGLGRKTGIDLPSEDAGLIPSREWKAHYYRTKSKSEQKWYDSETISVSIGQGAVALTPIQAAWAMGGLASGGRLKQPHLVDPDSLNKLGFKVPPLKDLSYEISAGTVDIVTRAMWGVVNDGGSGGTGTRAAVAGFDVAGKTGTAQVVGRQSYGKGEETEDHAWFVGFAPYRNPEIVVAAFVEHGGHGGSASAPIAHAIFDTYYRKKTGQFTKSGSGSIAALQPGR
jgi:penicillin-binding protein 2